MNTEDTTGAQEATAPLDHGAQNRCFGCGQANAIGLKLQFQVAKDLTVSASAAVSDAYEGPRGYLHGGIIATLLDEVMSKANWARGVRAMTRRMEVEYLRPVPSMSPIRLEGQVTRSEGRKHWTTARILSGEGTVLAEATALFVAIRSQSPAGNPAS